MADEDMMLLHLWSSPELDIVLPYATPNLMQLDNPIHMTLRFTEPLEPVSPSDSASMSSDDDDDDQEPEVEAEPDEDSEPARAYSPETEVE